MTNSEIRAALEATTDLAKRYAVLRLIADRESVGAMMAGAAGEDGRAFADQVFLLTEGNDLMQHIEAHLRQRAAA